MIRVNLIGGPKKAAGGRKGLSFALPTNLLPILWAAILVGSVLGGYFWRSSLLAESATLSSQVSTAQAQLATLQTVIDENQVFEARREMLQLRVETIEQLQRNQASPVVVLDQLSLAMDQVDYLWLDTMTQTNTNVSLAGTVTSQAAFADFIETLQNTGYFRNVNFGNLQQSGANFTFNLTAEFVPPPFPSDAEPDAGEGDEEADAVESDQGQG